ncbi:MAG: DUF4397 domain-containing protein [Candidatus Zixiibacteriota bacterium]
MRKHLRHLPLVGMLLAVPILTVSCSDDDDSNPVLSTPAPTANVIIVHASPDAPGVDIVVDNGAPAVEDLEFLQNTGYVALNSGTRNVKVNVANSTTTVINADLNLSPNVNYSVFAVNSVANIEPLVLVDDLSAPAAGKAHVRFVHLSPDAPSVDVALAGGGAVVFGNVAFKEFLGFTPLDAGTYNLEVRVAGTATVALPLPGITLQAGKIYTVFAKGFLSGTGSQALGAEIIVNN